MDATSETSNGALSRLLHRELLALLVLTAMAIGVYLGTRELAAVHRRLRVTDAAHWFRIGRAELAAGRPLAAVASLRRASLIDPPNHHYRLTLASALEAGGETHAARQVLLDLRALTPEYPEINLRLARLDRDRGDHTAAVRYYQNAIYGVWPEDAVDFRRSLRLEFIRYLLERQHTDRALSELLAIEANLGRDADTHAEAGQLFLQAGDAARALAHYRLALRQDSNHEDALAGAGTAAFTLGDYAAAQRYLRRVPERRADVTEARSIAAFVLARDPLLPRLPYAERRRRLEMNLSHTATRLAACTPTADSSVNVADLRARIEAARAGLRRSRIRQLETIEDGVDLIHRVQQEAGIRCGTPALPDRALLLIGERHRLDTP